MAVDMKSLSQQTKLLANFKTYVVDDNKQVRMSLAFTLDSLEIQNRTFESGEDFLNCLDELTPGPILLDIRMSGIDGIGVLGALAERGVRWPVIVITGHGDVAIAVTAMKLGAIEFLEKPFDPEMLVVTLTRAFGILSDVSFEQQEQAAARAQLASLTPRERDVVFGLIDGSANKIVAYKLDLSPRTVEMHRANAFAKLRLRTVADIIKLVGTAKLTSLHAGTDTSSDAGTLLPSTH
jgi:two-component system response regulator FixJ